MRLLLLSNSTMAGAPYLAWAAPHIGRFLGPVRLAFVPWAGVRLDGNAYAGAVADALVPLGIELLPVGDDPLGVLDRADAVAVGGGNTFHLLDRLHRTGLLGALRDRVRGGMPYVGWSAGANVACPTIRTTNDMPIVEPPTLAALGLIPFQINAHFTDARLPGHAGETRSERLLEFVATNPGCPVVALPEGTGLRVEDGRAELIGEGEAVVFAAGREPVRTRDPARHLD